MTAWGCARARFRRDPDRRALPFIYCTSVSPSVPCVSAIVRLRPASVVSANVSRK
jgi:hypothetical protein